MACNPNRKGRTFQGGYTSTYKYLNRQQDISPNVLTFFNAKFA